MVIFHSYVNNCEVYIYIYKDSETHAAELEFGPATWAIGSVGANIWVLDPVCIVKTQGEEQAIGYSID